MQLEASWAGAHTQEWQVRERCQPCNEAVGCRPARQQADRRKGRRTRVSPCLTSAPTSTLTSHTVPAGGGGWVGGLQVNASTAARGGSPCLRSRIERRSCSGPPPATSAGMPLLQCKSRLLCLPNPLAAPPRRTSDSGRHDGAVQPRKRGFIILSHLNTHSGRGLHGRGWVGGWVVGRAKGECAVRTRGWCAASGRPSPALRRHAACQRFQAGRRGPPLVSSCCSKVGPTHRRLQLCSVHLGKHLRINGVLSHKKAGKSERAELARGAASARASTRASARRGSAGERTRQVRRLGGGVQTGQAAKRVGRSGCKRHACAALLSPPSPTHPPALPWPCAAAGAAPHTPRQRSS